MINSVYGKTKENLRKRINMRLINNAEDFSKYTSKSTCITHKIFGKGYAAIHEIKPILILDKPIYVGFSVLDLIKWKMYDFHYNYTDILTYEIKSEKFMKNFLSGNICLASVIIQKIQKFLMRLMKKLLLNERSLWWSYCN